MAKKPKIQEGLPSAVDTGDGAAGPGGGGIEDGIDSSSVTAPHIHIDGLERCASDAENGC